MKFRERNFGSEHRLQCPAKRGKPLFGRGDVTSSHCRQRNPFPAPKSHGFRPAAAEDERSGPRSCPMKRGPSLPAGNSEHRGRPVHHHSTSHLLARRRALRGQNSARAGRLPCLVGGNRLVKPEHEDYGPSHSAARRSVICRRASLLVAGAGR